jgi:hypothetical protein
LVFDLIRTDRSDPRTNEEALATLRISAIDRDRDRAGRRFSSAIVELLLSGPPGIALTAPPAEATAFFAHQPALIDRRWIEERAIFGGETIAVAAPPITASFSEPATTLPARETFTGETVRVPLARILGARSGDKGGDASLGVWTQNDAAFRYVHAWLDVDALKRLLTDLAPYTIVRSELPNLRALLFVVKGLLGTGALSSTRMDPQAKTLAEYLRSKLADVPAALVDAR